MLIIWCVVTPGHDPGAGWLRPIFRVPSAMLRWETEEGGKWAPEPEPEAAGTYLYTRCECDHGAPGAGHWLSWLWTSDPGTRRIHRHGLDMPDLARTCSWTFVKHIVTKTTLHYIMWTFFLRGWFILSTSGEFSLLVLKDKYPVRTKCFVVSQPDNICWSAKIYCVK